MSKKPNVFRSGMYVSLEKKYMRIIESDRNLFRCDLQKSEETDMQKKYMFSINAFLNRIFIIMCGEERSDEIMLSNHRKRDSEHMTIKINKAIMKKMKQAGVCSDDDEPDTRKLSAFYCRHIEKYACLSQIDREKLFYKNIIEEFNSIMKNRVIIIKRNTAPVTAQLLPYEIIPAAENGHLYITGFSVIKDDSGRFVYRKPINIPMYKIIPYDENLIFGNAGQINLEKDLFFSYPTVDCYQTAIDKLKDRLADDGVLFISEKPRKVKVRLTDKGLDNLYIMIQYRPNNYNISKNDNHIVEFEATWLQTFLYFFKFGSDAEILEPQSYRESFRERFESALKQYITKKL